jgi:hypothetical protein
LERQAALSAARAAVLELLVELLQAKDKPADDAKRQEAVTAVEKKLAQRAHELQAVHVALNDPATLTRYTPLTPQYPRQSTGRRLALARWITSPQNPLFARVAVNHLWMRHFDQPLVSSVFDFGNNGARPTHPELLDWLAVEFIESGFSMKHLHRLIVTSRTYRLSSAPGAAEEQRVDPENRFLWRKPVGRMEAEVLRDALLACGDMLDRSLGGQELENEQAMTTFRRSLYYSCHPEAGGKSPFGELFDGPDPNECYRRTRSIMPQQALIMTNSVLVQQVSQRLAERLWGEVTRAYSQGPDTALSADSTSANAHFVRRAFRIILTREPTEAELKDCIEFLNTTGRQPSSAETEKVSDIDGRRRVSLVRVLFNHNDFLTIR